LQEEKDMTHQARPGKAQSVQVVEADTLDTMNETNSLIAQRAYEIYQDRGGQQGSDQEDWFNAESEVLHPLPIEENLTESALQLTAQLPGFDANDLEVVIGHRRAVICGVHPDSNHSEDDHRNDKKVMRIVEIPFEVDPRLSRATLEGGTLQIVLPRSR
jgi:HSP20 family molecular chaperone IbpA